MSLGLFLPRTNFPSAQAESLTRAAVEITNDLCTDKWQEVFVNSEEVSRDLLATDDTGNKLVLKGRSATCIRQVKEREIASQVRISLFRDRRSCRLERDPDSIRSENCTSRAVAAAGCVGTSILCREEGLNNQGSYFPLYQQVLSQLRSHLVVLKRTNDVVIRR